MHDDIYKHGDKLLDELENELENVKFSQRELHIIYANLLHVSEEMLMVFLQNGNEAILSQLERLQGIMIRIRNEMLDASAM